MDSVSFVKNENFSEDGKDSRKFLDTSEKPKDICNDNSPEYDKS